MKEVDPEREKLLAQLGELGLSEKQVEDLREDYRCGDLSDVQLFGLVEVLPQLEPVEPLRPQA